MSNKPPWIDQVLELSVEEAQTLYKAGVKNIYYDFFSDHSGWLSVDVIISECKGLLFTQYRDPESTYEDYAAQGVVFFMMKEGHEDAGE